MKKLSKEEILKLDINKNDRRLYLEAMAAGAEIALLSETATGYDIAILFGVNAENVH